MLKSRTLIALCKTVSLPGKGKIMGNKLLVLLAIGAISVAAFLACDNNRTPGTEPGNGSGSETPTPDLPRDQSETINMSYGQRTSTAIVQGTMTNEQWKGVADMIENLIDDSLNGSFTGDQDQVMDAFDRDGGVIFNVVIDPEGEFIDFKVIGNNIYIALSTINYNNIVLSIVEVVLERDLVAQSITQGASG